MQPWRKQTDKLRVKNVFKLRGLRKDEQWRRLLSAENNRLSLIPFRTDPDGRRGAWVIEGRGHSINERQSGKRFQKRRLTWNRQKQIIGGKSLQGSILTRGP